MAKKVTLEDSTTEEIIYPQTLVDSVQDEAGNILPNLVLMKDNATAFTPTADYQPATKKYVDDAGGGGGVQIILSSSQPSGLKAGDYWYQIVT